MDLKINPIYPIFNVYNFPKKEVYYNFYKQKNKKEISKFKKLVEELYSSKSLYYKR
jgi:hypothetical protein